MDYEQLQQYKKSLLERALSEGIRRNDEEVKIWSEYKERHEKVISGLETFVKELTVECMVPIGKKALMRGKLTNTNEILVSLGDGYFGNYSASQAIDLSNRRIKRANDILEGLQKERNLFESRQRIPESFDAFGGEDRKDFIEHWDNEKLDDWRVEHRQREKEYRKKLSELKNTEKREIQTTDDLFEKLDALELQEELEDELHRLEAARPDFYDQDLEDGEVYDESESDSSSDSESDTTLDDTVNGIKEKSALDNNIETDTREKVDSAIVSSQEDASKSPRVKNVEKKVVFGESQIKYFDNSEKIENLVSPVAKNSIAGKSSASSNQRINSNDIDDSDEDEVIRIEFKHSDCEPKIPESEDHSIISPRDIYNASLKSKSILKKTANNGIQSYVPPVDNSSVTDDEEDIEPVDNQPTGISAYNTIVKEIRQHVIDAPAIEPAQPQRPISKFKRERASAKKGL